jgi:hypothetical protein
LWQSAKPARLGLLGRFDTEFGRGLFDERSYIAPLRCEEASIFLELFPQTCIQYVQIARHAICLSYNLRLRTTHHGREAMRTDFDSRAGRRPFLPALPVILVAILFAFGFAAPQHPQTGEKSERVFQQEIEGLSREDLWKKVQDATNKGLPRTAVKYITPIIEDAVESEDYAEAIRAIGQKVALEGEIQGNKPEEKILMLEEELIDAPEEMKPVLRAILANWYWRFFQHNRWRFMQRTATAEAPGEDIMTWDLPRIFSEIDSQFSAALESTELLQNTSIGEYDDLLQKGTMPDRYRPTLYDFVVADALSFYSSGEQAAAMPQDPFVLSAESPVFASREEFVRWDVITPDPESPVYRAVCLYQDVLKFHNRAGNRDALLDWDLDRLKFGYNMAVGVERDARYKAALRRFVTENQKHKISARARHELASVVRNEGELVQAREIALQGMRQFPDSPGGKLCYNLVQQIEAPSVSIKTERVWSRPLPEIRVDYRNITESYFRLVEWDWVEQLKGNPRAHPEQISGSWEYHKPVLSEKPAKEWSVELPATNDYHSRTEVLSAPEGLAKGFYWLIASAKKNFGKDDNVVSMTPVWVSDVAIIMRTGAGGMILEGLVLDAESGTPIDGAEVRAWALAQPWRDVKLQELEPVRTNADGMFRVRADSRRQHVLLAEDGGSRLATSGIYSGQSLPDREHRFQRTVFFTDRALYRPGQTVHYKGICIDVNQREGDYKVIPGRLVKVIFEDVNGEKIEEQEVRSNDYGSISGSFTAPRDRLTGRMTIRAESPSGRTSVNVEEYKRPTFRVSFEAPEDAPRLNDTVRLTGRATAYTGASTDGADVRWRVVREVNYPRWWLRRIWWPIPSAGRKQEIAHGTARTDVDGTFEIEFVARPAPDATEEGNPTFRYTVHADVTDAAGETRSQKHVVNVGYTALNASLSCREWTVAGEEFDISVRTTTLDGKGQPAAGMLKIYSLKSPERVHRTRLSDARPYLRYGYIPDTHGELPVDLSDSATWPLDRVVSEREFSTDAGGHASENFELKTGAYRAVLETRDRFGKTVTAELPLRVVDPQSEQLTIKIPHLFQAPGWTVEPGDNFRALWGSGYDSARAYVEIEHRGELLQSYWTKPDCTQELIEQEVTEGMRGGFIVRVTMVRENRAYIESRYVNVPWNNKELDITWERFVSKLKPGQQEVWTAIIRGHDAETRAAEMVATLYDKSLDAFRPHGWPNTFNVFRHDYSSLRSSFENNLQSLRRIKGSWHVGHKRVYITYRSYPHQIVGNLWGYDHRRFKGGGMLYAARSMVTEGAQPVMRENEDKTAGSVEEEGPGETPELDLDHVDVRENLDETAFFYPHLTSDDDGEVSLQFTMPETLTEWQFFGFAHDTELRAGLLAGTTVTAKDLMVQPNPPRFLREGDTIEFTVRVTNQSPSRQTGTVRLRFEDARTGADFNENMGNLENEKKFDVPSKQSRTYSWRLVVPYEPGIIIYRAVGSTGRLSDGEEGYLPILSHRIMVTESLPLPAGGHGTWHFEFDKLLKSDASETLESKTLTLQVASNPAWYAVMALPYLMESRYENSEAVFNRLYANELARFIAGSDPKIRRIFDLWKGTETLDSPLEKNEEIKDVVLEETPWVRQAQSESQARRNVGILFDKNRLNRESQRTSRKLAEMQLSDGSWPWFPGGRPNDYITLYIVTGFGRLRHLGVDIDVAPAVKALGRLDRWMENRYREILKWSNPEKYVPSPTIALYLYGRTFFLADQRVADEHREAFDFFVGRAKDHWLRVRYRQSQGHIALALNRLGERDVAQDIMRSIKERSMVDDELGRFWRDTERSWWWYRAPIETQALMIEAFDEVMNDAEAVEGCRIWLLKQKQTQDWETTRATADAVYGLLLRGRDILASDEVVEVFLGGHKVEPEHVEPGTGFYEKRYVNSEIRPEMGMVTVKKVDDGLAWGGLHWQYLEDIANITSHKGTHLTLEKAVYTKEYTGRGEVINQVDGTLEVGDELVIRVVLKTDRDMEYVHLKDYRGSGTEPVNVISGYRYQDGLWYYESTRDTASHFFIDYLPKGTYVFEYSVRVQHRGVYESGIAAVQCLYAPEFNSHSESTELRVE